MLYGLLMAALVVATISLQRAYTHVPLKELRRRARAGDQLAELLHRAAAYGPSLRVLLWFLIGISTAGFFVFVSNTAGTLLAVVVCSMVVWIGFARGTTGKASRIGLFLARLATPILAWLLLYLHPILEWLIGLFHKFWPIHIHTGLYEKEDLLELLNHQNTQADNRMDEHELALAFHALTFGDKLVSEFMTPRRIVKTVAVGDDIGPVLMDDLHKSGFSRFPVYEGKKENIVGTLFLRDLVRTKGSSKVSKVMRPNVVYVHEDQTLRDALQAILKTRHHLLVVVNSFEEYVGVLSIEDIFEELAGQPIQDEFDQYEDLRAVATRKAKVEHKAHEEVEDKEAKAKETPSSDETEVVE